MTDDAEFVTGLSRADTDEAQERVVSVLRRYMNHRPHCTYGRDTPEGEYCSCGLSKAKQVVSAYLRARQRECERLKQKVAGLRRGTKAWPADTEPPAERVPDDKGIWIDGFVQGQAHDADADPRQVYDEEVVLRRAELPAGTEEGDAECATCGGDGNISTGVPGVEALLPCPDCATPQREGEREPVAWEERLAAALASALASTQFVTFRIQGPGWRCRACGERGPGPGEIEHEPDCPEAVYGAWKADTEPPAERERDDSQED